MKWFRDHDPEFLARLRRDVRNRAEVRQLRLRRPHWNRLRNSKLEGLAGLALLVLVGFGLARQPEGPAALNRGALEATLALVSLFLVSVLERQISGMLTHWPDLATLLRLPADDDWMVRRQWGRGLTRFPFVLLTAFIAAVSVSLDSHPGWVVAGGALLFALTLSVLVLTLATWLAGSRFGPLLSGGLWTGVVLLWLGSKLFPEFKSWLVLVLNQNGEWLTLVLPTGWVIRPFYRWQEGGAAIQWLSLLPGVVLVASLTTALARLPGRLRLRDQALLAYASQIPDDATDEFRKKVNEALTLPAPCSLGELRETVLTRSFLELDLAPDKGGWLERWVWRCWNPAERQLAALAYETLPQWSKMFRLSGILLLLGVSAAGLGVWGKISWLLVGWLIAIGALIYGLAPMGPTAGRLENSWEMGQGTVTAVGLFPLSFPEICRWAIKTARLRLLVGSPLVLLLGAVLGIIHPELISPRGGVECGAVALLAVVGLQPLWMAGNLIGRGGPIFVGRRRFGRRLTWLTLGVFWLGASAGAVAATIWVGFGWGLGCALVSVVIGEVGWRWMTRVVGRGGVELLIPPEVSG